MIEGRQIDDSKQKPGMVAHACNPRCNQEVEAKGLSSKSSLATLRPVLVTQNLIL